MINVIGSEKTCHVKKTCFHFIYDYYITAYYHVTHREQLINDFLSHVYFLINTLNKINVAQ